MIPFVQNFLVRHAPLRSVYDYASVPKETLDRCPCCETTLPQNLKPFCAVDRYGFPTQTLLCPACESFFISPRPTPAAYDALYNEGHYRRLIAAFSGKADDHATASARVEKHVEQLGRQLAGRPVRVLNVGGTRSDYDLLCTHLSLQSYLCINPGAQEAGLGYPVARCTLESFESNGETFDLICLFGTLNHLMWPLASFKKIHGLLAPEGLFVFDYKDPIAKMQRMTHPSGALQFDHPVYPSRRAIADMLAVCGMGQIRSTTDNHRVFFYQAQKPPQEQPPISQSGAQTDVLTVLRRRAAKYTAGMIVRAVRSLFNPSRNAP